MAKSKFLKGVIVFVFSPLLILTACTVNDSSVYSTSSAATSSETLSSSSSVSFSSNSESASVSSSSSSEETNSLSSRGDEYAYTTISIAELLEKTANVIDEVYEVSGIMETRSTTDSTGQFWLTDPVTFDTIYVYGATGNSDAITYQSGVYTWNNPKDAATSLLGVNNGMYVTLHAMFSYYSSKSLPELDAIVCSSESADYKYVLSCSSDGNGSVGAPATELSYDETAILDIAPNSGYAISSVSVTNAQGASSLILATDGSYILYGTCVNEVYVTFASTEISYKSLAVYDFSALPYTEGTNYGALDGDGIRALFGSADYLQSGANIVTSCSAYLNTMLANATQGPKTLGLKLGKKGAGGNFTLDLSSSVDKVVITATGWPSDSGTIDVNDGSSLALVDSTSTVFSFVLASSSSSVSIASTARCIITGVELLAIVA
jgi:hypothetical protein